MLNLLRKNQNVALKPVPAIDVVSLSETGLVRQNNEDHLYVSVPRRVFCAADGMGGGDEGEMASEIVCASVRHMMAASPISFEPRIQAVCQALQEANDFILAYAAERNYKRMGSTAVVFLIDPLDPSQAAVVHVGDSRLYRIRRCFAEALTTDHSVGTSIADVAGKEAAALRDRAHPLAHVLTRAIGGDAKLRCTVTKTDVRPGDRFILCTDGVHDVISNARLAIYASCGSLDSARDRLAADIVKHGAPDNYSFIIVGC